MKIDVFIAGHLIDVVQGLRKKYIGLEIQDGTTLKGVAEELNIKKELVFMFIVNRKRMEAQYVLQDGDVVTIFSPSAGG